MPGILNKHDGNELDAVSDAVDDGVYLFDTASDDAAYRASRCPQ